MLRLMMLLIVTFPFLLPAAESDSAAFTMHPPGSTKAPYGFIERLPYSSTNVVPQTVYPLVFFLHGQGEVSGLILLISQVIPMHFYRSRLS